MDTLNINPPTRFALAIRQGDTKVLRIRFPGPDGGPLPAGELELYKASTWLWQVRANQPSGRLLGEIACEGIVNDDGTFSVQALIPRATSQALIPSDRGSNYSDLERMWTQGGYELSHTPVVMDIVCTDDTSVPALTPATTGGNHE